MINKEIGTEKGFNGQYTIECSEIPRLPKLTFTFNGNKFELEGKDYIPQVQNQCISGFTDLDIPPPLGLIWIIGDVFLRKYYSIYNLTNNRVGFAKSK